MSIDPSTTNGVFTPETIMVINRAYAHALRSIGGHKADVARRAALAKQMIAIARCGERDEKLLSLRSLAALQTDVGPVPQDNGAGAP